MRLFIDTNIAIDYVAKRGPQYEQTRLVMMLARASEFELWMSASQITDLFYVLSNGGKPRFALQATDAVRALLQVVHLCSPTQQDIARALDSAWEDFEDALMYQSALKMWADAILTRNQQDYVRSSLPALDCEGLFSYLKRKKHVSYDYL